MTRKKEKTVSVATRMTVAERDRIDVLAKLTGRDRSNVIRRLLYLLDIPEVKQALGKVFEEMK